MAHSRSVDLRRSQSARSAREERHAHIVATAEYDIERQAWDCN